MKNRSVVGQCFASNHVGLVYSAQDRRNNTPQKCSPSRWQSYGMGKWWWGHAGDSMGTYLPRCQHYGAERVWSVNVWHSTPTNYSFVFLQLFFWNVFFWVVVLPFIQLVCFSACMHLVDHWERGTGLTSRMPAKFKTFQHQTRALPGPLHLDKVFVSERGQTKRWSVCGQVWCMGRFPNFAHSYSNSFSWHFCVFRHGKITLIS